MNREMDKHTMKWWPQPKGSLGSADCSCGGWKARGTLREVKDRHMQHVYEAWPKVKVAG